MAPTVGRTADGRGRPPQGRSDEAQEALVPAPLVVLGLLEPESDEPAPLDGGDPSADEEDEDDDDCSDDSDVGDLRLSVR
jgi:hypothetical protein